MEFKAEKKGKEIIVKPIIVKKDGNITIHVPSFPLIQKLKDKFKDGKRNI